MFTAGNERIQVDFGKTRHRVGAHRYRRQVGDSTWFERLLTHARELVRRSQFHGLRFRDFTIDVASDDVSRLGIGSDPGALSDG
jgi:hypothetical protein